MRKDNQAKNKMPVLIICIFAIIIAILAVVIVFLFKELNNNQEPKETQSNSFGKGNLVVDEDNIEEIENQLKDSVQDGMFQMNMNTTWRFKKGNATSTNAYVSNAKANHYPITFEVYLNGDEKIYSSTLMPVGTQLKELTLSKTLSVGQHEAVCMYHLWDENEQEVGSFGVNVVIIVE